MMRFKFSCVLIVLAVAAFSSADQGRTEIGPTDTFPIVIDEPGSYVLTADLHVTATSSVSPAIKVDANNVSLDLGGHVIQGPGASVAYNHGVQAPVYGFSLRNGIITGFLDGVSSNPGLNYGANRFTDLTIHQCGERGLYFVAGVAERITVFDNGERSSSRAGLECIDCTISDVMSNGNSIGISIENGSAVNCNASSNSSTGFYLRYAALNGGSAHDNGGSGVYAPYGNLIVGVNVVDNGEWGIDIGDSGTWGDNNVVNCTGRNNTLGNIDGCGPANGCHQNYLP